MPANDFATNFTLLGSYAPELTVHFDVRDMKYLSNSNHSEWPTTDADVMVGNKAMKISLNFQDLMTQDATGETYFVVGGRTYYEIQVKGEKTISFITKGFFDQEGYSQPAKKADGTAIAIGVSCGVVALGLIVLGCYCYKKRKDEIDQIKGVQKEDDVVKPHVD